MAEATGRIARISRALTPGEWARAGGMVAVIVGLNVLGWGMLAAAVGRHYHISGTAIFGFGTGILAYTLGMRHAPWIPRSRTTAPSCTPTPGSSAPRCPARSCT